MTNSEVSPQIQRQPAAALGVLLMLAGLLLNARSLGALLATDGSIDGDLAPTIILGMQLGIVGLGIAVLLLGGRLSGSLRNALMIFAVGGIATGGLGLLKGPGESAPVAQRPIMELDELCEWISVHDPNVGTANLEKYEGLLASAREQPTDTNAIGDAAESLGEVYLRHAKNAEALALFEEALELAIAGERELPVQQRLRRTLGVAHMRIGETSHCIADHNPESCLFPIPKGGVWNNTSGAVAAAEYFLAFLNHEPQRQDVRWLLNVAHQVAGTHPEGVPEAFLIPLSTFESSEPGASIGRFREVGGDLGVNELSMCGGAIIEDIDGDGHLDMFSTTMSFCQSVKYFHNSGDGSFEDWTERAGLSKQLGGFNCVQGDVDGDGRLDILVLRGAWQGLKFGAQRNSLLRQRPDGSFQDVTEVAGLGKNAYPSQVGAFADYDLDGDLDLFVGNEHAPCQLFTNDGSGRFQDRALEAGVAGLSSVVVKGASWGDYDNDGDPDLYVSNYGRPNLLYRNDGQGQFTEVAKQLGVQALDSELIARPGDEQVEQVERTSSLGRYFGQSKAQDRTFVSWFWDMDNDGWLDLYVGSFGGSLADVAGSYTGEPVAGRRHLRVYRNDQKGGFEDVSRAMGVDQVHLPMGANYGDLNNDGFQDFYLGTGRPGFDFLVPNVLYLNLGGERFANVTAAAGVGHLQKGHGVAFGDLDQDGDLDIFAQMGGFYYADAFHDAVFENPGNDNHWLTLQLRGVTSNRFGIGARLKAVLQTPAGQREVHAMAGSGASFGGSSLEQELGLGDATAVLSLEVQWPGGELQVLKDLPMDCRIRLTQGEADFELLASQQTQLGG